MANLSNLAKKIKDLFDETKVGSPAQKFWAGNYSNPLIGVQGFLEDKSRINLPRFDQTKARSIPLNMAAGFGEAVINEPKRLVSDIGTGIGKTITGQDFNPTSSTMRLTNMGIDAITNRQNPLSTVKINGGKGYGAGKWNVPFTNIKLPEMGFSESPAAGMTKLGFGVAEPFMAIKGAAKPLLAGGYTALGGGANAVLGDRSKTLEQRFIQGANQAAPKAIQTAGFLNSTNPLLDSIGGKAITRIPLKSGANVIQGLGQDQVIGQETTPEGILLDAVFPIAQDVGAKTFKSAGEAMRDVEARLKQALGMKLRNNKGLYTTADKFAKGTRAYRKSGKYMNGAALGFEPYQDENGDWRVRFNKERAVLGLGVGLGMTKAVTSGNLKDLEASFNRSSISKGLDAQTKEAVLEEAQRMLAGGIGDTGVIKNGDSGFRYSANPDWYRDFYKQAGKAPSNDEFFDIALSRVRPQKGIENVDDLDALIKSWGGDISQTKDLVSSPEVPQATKNPLLQKQQLPQEPKVPSKLQSVPQQTGVEKPQGVLQEKLPQSVEIPKGLGSQTDDIAKQQARKELEGLMTYNDKLIKSGVNPKVADKTSYKQYKGETIEDVVKKSATPLSKKVSLLDYIRTPKNVLKKIGLEKEANALKTAHNAYLEELPKEIDRVTEWYKRAPSPESAVKIFKHLDGQGVQLDANEAQIAKEIREYLVGWADRLKLPKDRRITNYITHIFDEQLIKKEFDEDLAKILQDKVAGSVYDPFTLERLGALGYKENVWDALDAYVKRGVRKANMDPALEQAQKAADSLELSQYNYVKSYIDRINMRPTQLDNLLDNAIKQSPIQYRLGGRPTARLSKLARQMVYRGTLGLNVGSALRNLTQGVNTYSELGEKYTVLGYTNLLKNGTKELDEVGLFRNGMVEDRSLNATKKFWEKTDKVLFSLFELAERINRGSAYYGAKAKGLSKGMTEEQARKYAVDVVEKTQFTFGKIDTPVGMQSDIVKLLTQFQSYNFKQIEFLAGKAKARDIAGLARYSIGSFVMLNTIGQLLGMDYKDLIPSIKIGASPVFTGSRDIIQSITGGEDEYGNELSGEDRIKQAGKAVIPFIPAGVQGKKTIGGVLDLNRGYTQTKSGNVRTPLNQTPTNWLRGVVFGTNTLPEVQAHWDAGTKALSEKQSEEFRNAPNRQEYYDSVLKGREENKQNDIVRARVEQTGQEEMSNGKLYYMGYKTDSETGQVERVVKSLDVGELDNNTQVGGLNVSTREKDGFPFPDYVKSTAGQVLRADLNLSGQGNADIVFHMKLPNGKVLNVPQSVETFNGDGGSYGLQLAIPKDAGVGVGEVWATVNGKEIAGTRKKHEIIAGNPVDRYNRDAENRYYGETDSTFEQASSLGKYVITTESGNKSLVDLSKPIKYPEKTGQPNLDKELISRYNSAITTRINNIEKVYLDGQITAEQAEKAISELTKAKISTKKKKGVKVSGGKISPVKMKITQSNTKLPTIKIKPAPKAKIAFKKPKSIKIAKKQYAKNKPVKFKNTLTDSLTKLA